MNNDENFDIRMDEITLNDDINYLELGKQDLLSAIKNQLIELKGEIYNTRIEQQKEYILYCSYKTSMSKNDCLDFLEYNMERFDMYDSIYQALNEEITRLKVKYDILKKMYIDLYENKNIS